VLVTKDTSYFLTDFRYSEAAAEKVKTCEVLMYERMEDTLSWLVEKHGIKRILFEHDEITLTEADRYKGIFEKCGAEAGLDTTLDGILRDMRIIKTEEEVKKIRASQEITEAAFGHILTRIRPDATERELALEIEYYMRRNGADGVAFELIVVSGKNSSRPHGVPSEKPLERGDFVTMDIGALLDGYHSDMTRTVAVGSASDAPRRVYESVLSAQKAAISAVRPGIPCGDVDKAARDIIETNYKRMFGHSTGHGVGMQIHEAPSFAPLNQTVTKPGMVVTVEPGIYLPGRFGVRIEDMVVITEEGCKNLTNAPKELLIV
jgi:Xaa-Pro aminopeptidase